MFKFGYDHAFSRWIPKKDYDRFGDLGFSINSEHVVEHEGGQFCRFLAFNERKYLEFVDIQDDDVFFASEKKNGQPNSTGISLNVNYNLKEFYNEKKNFFSKTRNSIST